MPREETEEIVAFGFAEPTRVDISRPPDPPPPSKTDWYRSKMKDHDEEVP